MKLPVKSTSITLGVVSLAFVGGVVIASHLSQTPAPAKTQLYKSTADVTSSQTDTSTVPVSPTPQTSVTPANTTPASTSTPSTGGTVSAPQTASSTPASVSSTLTDTAPSAATAPQAPATPPVTAVSAVLSDWYDGPTYTNPDGSYTTQQLQDCVFTYNDGSVKKSPYRSTSASHDASGKLTGGGSSSGTDALCTTAAAPAAN